MSSCADMGFPGPTVTKMAELGHAPERGGRPQFSAVVELLKPITWFAPMWAYGCGVVSSGQ